MKILKQGISLALLGATLAVVPGVTQAQASAPAAPTPDGLVQKMRQQADGAVQVSAEASTDRVGFVRAGRGGDLLPGKAGKTPAQAEAKAKAYLGEFAKAFGAAPGQLVQDRVQSNEYGTVVTYVQEHRGVPVFGSMVRAHVDADGDLTAVNGFAAPDISVDTEPARSKSAAEERAVAFVKSSPADDEHAAKASGKGLRATDTQLIVYRTGAIKGEEGRNVLAYDVEVGDGAGIRERVIVDADAGKILNRWSMVHGAYEDRLPPDAELYETSPDAEDLEWRSGEPFPDDLNQDQQNLIISTGEAYWFFKHTFGRDSYDGNGATMKVVNNDPRINCPNANWNGQTTNYCDGVTSDDVVAHEWGHAYTEFTWGGIYQWQPGALNESYSDVWGETIDLINGREDEEEGDIERHRPVGQCSTHSPATPVVTINSPASIAGPCTHVGMASYGPQLTGEGVTGDVVIGTDAVETGGTATDGCSPLANAAEVAGKIVMVDRGLCDFVIKTQNAQAAGAIAVIIGNRENAIISPSGTGDYTIPTVTIGLDSREKIRTALANGQPVNVTMKDAAGDRVDSFRWLIGEKSTAFGGAIRDMWNPNCYGDPGKVSDVQYHCGTDDSGGVHGNSGVPNHGYALLVDGGTFNGQTVDGIGLVKAAHIYFKAMNEYMTPVSDFADHADALEASCTDLVGKQLRDLTVTETQLPASRNRVTTADCAQVSAMAAAVELRKEPEQCDFKPLLDPNTPGVCGEGTVGSTVFEEDFEDGLAGWEQGSEIVFEGGIDAPWRATYDFPEGNAPEGSERVAFGPAPDQGQCVNGPGDFSSANWITSDEITVGEEGDTGPRLSFDHNVATELGYDGGNLQLRVNGEGEFAPVPAAAYVFNKPSVLTTEAGGNTNPLAGQPGFTGSDGGSLVSDWGTSIVDLEAAGVAVGDTIELRFAIGRDGCGGVDGWWVDNVRVVTCTERQEPPAAEASTTTATAPARVRFRNDFNVRVNVQQKDGDQAAGVVRVYKGDASIGRGVLQNGRVVIRVTRNLGVGQHRLVVRYQGNATTKPSADVVRVTVIR